MTKDKTERRDTQLIKPEIGQPAILKIADLIKFENSLNIFDLAGRIVNGELVIKGTMLRSAGTSIKISLDYIIETTAQYLNAKVSSDNIKLMVESIMRRYPVETFEDIVFVFREIRDGKYKYYNNFSFPWIAECITKHLDRKYQIRENLSFDNAKHDFTTRFGYLRAIVQGKWNEKQNKKENDELGYNTYKAKFLSERETSESGDSKP
jgi:hypothetical protein